jgi:hypothetical protein
MTSTTSFLIEPASSINPAIRPHSIFKEAGKARRIAEKIAYGIFFCFIFFACFGFLDVSPYDFIAIPAILIWLALGIKIHKAVVVFLVIMFLYNFGMFISLLPYLSEADPVLWSIQSFYLMVTGFFFTMFFSDETHYRVNFALQAYLVSCVFASILALIGYFDVWGLEQTFSRFGRASGPFNDPNVLGSFLTLGALYIIGNFLNKRVKYNIINFVCLMLILSGIFLSFSRGSWGGTLLAIIMIFIFTFKTATSAAIRRRVTAITILTCMGGFLVIAGLLTVDEIAENFTKRAQVTQDYDEGVTGRFGNQLRSLPMLMERPNGFGPLRFRLWFGLEPHNSYIGGFANGGWLGGFAFLAMVLITTFIGFRLCLKPSPYQRLAHIVFPALFMFFVQGVQIDVEHWRHVFMLFGMVWGLEAARIAWMKQNYRLTKGQAAPKNQATPKNQVPPLTDAARYARG